MPPSRTALPTPAERAANLAALEKTVRREIRWAYARAVFLCIVSAAIALGATAWSVHTTDEASGQIAFWGGLLVGNAGIMWTLFATYARAVKEGWV